MFQNFGGRQSHYRRFYYQPSTFLHNFDPPVYMSDDEDSSQGYFGSVDTESQADSVDDFVEETVSVSTLQPLQILLIWAKLIANFQVKRVTHLSEIE